MDSSIKSLRDTLYVQLTNTLLHGVIDDTFTPAQSREISGFILGRLDRVRTKDQMLEFLHNLSTRWAQYNPFYVKMKYEGQQKADEEKMQEIKSKLNQFIKLTHV